MIRRGGGAVLALALAAVLASAAARPAERFKPASPLFVVLELPAGVPFDGAEREPLAARDDPHAAARLAAGYIARAHKLRDDRYFGRAEAVLARWVDHPGAPEEVLILQADIEQNRHDFRRALQRLDAALDRAPRSSRARLLRASIRMVQADFQGARGDCSALIGLGEASIGTICLAAVLGSMGQAQRAVDMIALTLDRDVMLEPGVRGWALAILADIEARRGDPDTAVLRLQESLQADPASESSRVFLADLLIARGRPQAAVHVLDVERPSVGLLTRRFLAASVLGDDKTRLETEQALDELLELEKRRGEGVHLREETMLARARGRPPEELLSLAQANFAIQREAIDARLLAAAIARSRDAAARESMLAWVQASGFRDRFVESALRDGGA